MNLENEIKCFLSELEKKYCEITGEDIGTDPYQMLQQWPEFKFMEEQLSQIFQPAQNDLGAHINKIETKSIDEENAELISSLTKLKDKIQKNVQTNR